MIRRFVLMLCSASLVWASGADAQTSDHPLRPILAQQAQTNLLLRVRLLSGDSIEGRLNQLKHTALLLDDAAVELDSIAVLSRRSIQSDPVGDKALLGGIAGGLLGLLAPIFYADGSSASPSTQIAVSVAGGAAIGAGMAALIDAAVGREIVWRELWRRP